MTAIVGIAGWPQSERELHCRTMLGQLTHLGGVEDNPFSLGDATFAGSADRFAKSCPIVETHKRFLLAGDIRLTNREELARALRIDRPLDDAALLLMAWLKWGERCFDQLAGDFAFAVWDAENRSLTIARDPTGQRPLFYRQQGKTVGFASMAAGLLAVPQWRQGFDTRAIAAMLGHDIDIGNSYFAGICRVRPGCAVTFANGQARHWRHWWPPQNELPLDLDALAETYLDTIKQAVAAQLPAEATVGVHLSSGWDSSAVAATLASLRPTSMPFAFTSAPREGFTGPVPRDRFADESSLAGLTAAHLGLRHSIVRSGPAFLASARTQALLYEEPFSDAANMSWSRAIYAAAKSAGVDTILTGEMGNLSLNAGGLSALNELVRQRRFVSLAKEIRAAARSGRASWKGGLYNSFRHTMPPAVRGRLEQIFLKAPGVAEVGFAREGVRNQALRPSHPSYSGRYAERFDMIAGYDAGKYRAGALAEFGIRECDPTADRRVLDFSFRLPPEALLHDGEWKPLARRALGRILPAEILRNPLRGFQAADWYERLDKQAARDLLEEVRGAQQAADIIDFDKVERTIDEWPTAGWADAGTFARYRVDLPIALQTAVFIQEFAALAAPSSSSSRK